MSILGDQKSVSGIQTRQAESQCRNTLKIGSDEFKGPDMLGQVPVKRLTQEGKNHQNQRQGQESCNHAPAQNLSPPWLLGYQYSNSRDRFRSLAPQ